MVFNRRMTIEEKMSELSSQGFSDEAVARRLNYLFVGERFTRLMVRATLRVLQTRSQDLPKPPMNLDGQF